MAQPIQPKEFRFGLALRREDIPARFRIDDLGRIWTPRQRRGTGEQRAEYPMPSGYLYVRIAGKRGRGAHRIVYAWFHGEVPAGQIIRHLNGVRDDNRPENLAAGSFADNAADAVRHGMTLKGERNHKAVLTDERVRELRRRWAAGETQTALAIAYGVCQDTVAAIVHGRTWRHVI